MSVDPSNEDEEGVFEDDKLNWASSALIFRPDPERRD